MVNVRFPPTVRYGFEMVDAPDARKTAAKAGINRKFTPNRIRSFFCKFSHI
jgi:hypothetical protein